MASSTQGRRNRAPRVNVPNREGVVINIGGRQVTGVLCKLSINGGSVRLAKCINESTLAEITLRTASGRIVSAIEFLKPSGDGIHGFRFIQLDPLTRSTLEDALRQMRKQGLGDRPRSVIELCTNAARRVMQKAKSRIEGA